jgi:hypothetical protein
LSDAEVRNATLDAPSKDEVTEKNGKNNKSIHANFIIIRKCYLIAGTLASFEIDWSTGFRCQMVSRQGSHLVLKGTPVENAVEQ